MYLLDYFTANVPIYHHTFSQHYLRPIAYVDMIIFSLLNPIVLLGNHFSHAHGSAVPYWSMIIAVDSILALASGQ
jgi:hypothetical protein